MTAPAEGNNAPAADNEDPVILVKLDVSVGGLADNDVRSIVTAGDFLYVGLGTGHISRLNESEWLAGTPTPASARDLWVDLAFPSRAAVHDIAVGIDQTLWVASSEGLFSRDLEAEHAPSSWRRFGMIEGLPHPELYAIALIGETEVVTAGIGGLSLGNGDGHFVSLGFERGLPGQHALDVFVDGQSIWTRGMYGTAKLRDLAAWRSRLAEQAQPSAETDLDDTLGSPAAGAP